MAQVPSTTAGRGRRTSELYQWLRDREERAYEAPGRTLPWSPEQPAYTGRPELLAALRAGEPVNVHATALPKWARPDRGKLHWWHRANVHPDGAVEFLDDDGSLWLAEAGL